MFSTQVAVQNNVVATRLSRQATSGSRSPAPSALSHQTPHYGISRCKGALSHPSLVVSASQSLHLPNPEDHWDLPFASIGMFASDAGACCEEEANYSMVMDAEDHQGMTSFHASSSASPYSAEWLAGSEINPDGLDSIIRQAERRQAGNNPKATPKPYISPVEVGAEPDPEGLATLVQLADAAAATAPVMKHKKNAGQ